MNVSMKFILFDRPISTKTHVSSFIKSRKTIEYIADLIKIDFKARFISKLQTNTIFYVTKEAIYVYITPTLDINMHIHLKR